MQFQSDEYETVLWYARGFIQGRTDRDYLRADQEQAIKDAIEPKPYADFGHSYVVDTRDLDLLCMLWESETSDTGKPYTTQRATHVTPGATVESYYDLPTRTWIDVEHKVERLRRHTASRGPMRGIPMINLVNPGDYTLRLKQETLVRVVRP